MQKANVALQSEEGDTLEYIEMLQLAQKRGYHSFTALQEYAFLCEETHHYEKDLFIVGQTSSGKTLIPLLLYAFAVKEAKENDTACPKMLFVVPYRALAAQKLKEISAFFEDENLKIIQSTGEFRQDDDLVQKGEVDIAVIITEKVYKYEARDSTFLSLYDYLVLDEIGLIDSSERGIRLDFIFAWAHSQRILTGKPRTIALGTPFYDWKAYINSYGFYPIEVRERPVRLAKTAVTYNQFSIVDVEGKCGFLRPMRLISNNDVRNLRQKYEVPMTGCPFVKCLCPVEELARQDPKVFCSATQKPCNYPIEYVPHDRLNGFQYILLKICRTHLLAGHQILVFVNDRERVKELCRFLYGQLRNLLPAPPPAEECKKTILDGCGLDGEDVFGILEYEDGSSVELDFYQSFCCGVGFHSAALPNELRTYVENKFLGRREMKIVVSTETLAFGINSAVDVVVVADLYKHESTGGRFLTVNEYQNYAGRAGRLRPGVRADEAGGYVYTLIKSKFANNWGEMKQYASVPQRLYSRFHMESGQSLPFFLMNNIPVDSTAGITVEQLVNIVSTLPNDGSCTPESLTQKVENGVQFLLQQNLVAIIRTRARGRRESQHITRYCLTSLGSQLRGFILDSRDYLLLATALDEYIDEFSWMFHDADKITFLYRLLQTKHAENGLNAIFSTSETRQDLEQLRSYIQLHAPSHNRCPTWLDQCRNERILSFLAAILAWTDGESAKTLYRQFGIHYALLSKVSEQIAYLIEIAAEMLPFHLETIWNKKQHIYQERMKLSFDDFLDQLTVKKEDILNLFISVFYGINTDISASLLEFLDAQASDGDDPCAAALSRVLSLHSVNPKSARMHRRIAVRYRFFQAPPAVDWTDISARNNYLNQHWQYRKDVEEMGPHITAFFQMTFGSTFTEIQGVSI